MKLKLQVFSVDIFRGKILEQTQQLQYEAEIEYEGFPVDRPSAEIVTTSLPTRQLLSEHLTVGGFYLEADEIKMVVSPSGLTFLGEVVSSPERAIYFFANQEPPTPTAPQPAPVSTAPEPDGPSEGEATARIFRKWRGVLNKLTTSRDALKAKQDAGGRLTPDEMVKYQQTLGAVNTLSGVLSDLQMVRSVNESVLNI